jgi:hypothetical protein
MPATLPAFIGLTIADSHLIPPTPIAPAQFNAPVFALNYQVPPNPSTPLPALIDAFDRIPPTPIHSPVFFGVETFLSGGITIGGGGNT